MKFTHRWVIVFLALLILLSPAASLACANPTGELQLVAQAPGGNAEQGHGVVQDDRGWIYRLGGPIAPEDRQEVLWYRRTVGQGGVAAQLNLGEKRGVAQDDRQSEQRFRMAAEQGLTIAPIILLRHAVRGFVRALP